jgi:hypothetical protein
LQVPFLRRTHPEPEWPESSGEIAAVRSGRRVQAAQGYGSQGDPGAAGVVKGKPESFTINLAVLKSLTRAEYSPQIVRALCAGQRALRPFHQPDPAICRSDDSSPARSFISPPGKTRAFGRETSAQKIVLDDCPTHDELVELGKHLALPSAAATMPSASCGR